MAASAEPAMDPKSRITHLEAIVNEGEQRFGADFGGAPEDFILDLRGELEATYSATLHPQERRALYMLYQRLNGYLAYSANN